MSSGNNTDTDSSSPKGSLPSTSDIDSKSPPPKSEKDSDKDDAPPPTSNASSKTPPSPSQSTPPQSSSPSPEESPSKKSPPPPSPPVKTPPHSPPSRSPPSSSPSHTAPSSPPPPPLSSDAENSSPGPPEHSQSSPDSQDPSSSKNSSNNSPPSTPDLQDTSSSENSSNNPPSTDNVPPPQTRVEGGVESGSNYPSSPLSPGLPAGSTTRPGGSNDSMPSTSGGNSGGGNSNPGLYVGIAFAGLCIIVLVLYILVTEIRKRKRKAVHEATHIPPNMKPDGHYYGPQPQEDDHYKNGGKRESVEPLGTSKSVHPKNAQIAFSYESILEITNGFSSQNIIGEGGFGCVYKGWLSDGRAVAVKKLKAGSRQGDREFRAEVEIINRVHHRHLVSLVGYCISEQQKILMYEFVPNGTLDHHLHGKGMPVLDWTKRVKIAIGAAKGLAYLHEDCRPKIIHRDIKSANILLDDDYAAQVSDFGLARLTDDGNTHVSTRVMGTFGYMAPEYARSGKLTDRSDVFSFGVVLLELLTGRRPVDQTRPLGEESLVEWARPHLIHAIETGDFSKLIDTRLENHFVESEVLRMIEAATACVRHSAPKRPRMLQIMRALDGGSDLIDLSNGVKYGQSTAYDSAQYDEETMRFRMMNGVSFASFEFDLQSEEYSSRELSGIQRVSEQDNSGGVSGSRAFSKSGRSRHTKEY